MHTRRLVLSLLAGLHCMAWAGVLAQAAAPARPNVILIMTDDQGYGDVAAHGNPLIQTPHLDALYRESVRLTDFHVDPTCSPTRSALMSGRYSTRTGVWHTIMGRSLMDSGELTMAEVFAAAGYRTGMIGKWHLGDNYPCRPQDQGFEQAFYHGGGGVGQGPDYWGNDYFDDTYFRQGRPEQVSGYCTDVWFENALEFVATHRDGPFFLYLSTNAPHGPFLVDEKYSRPYAAAGLPHKLARFYGMITNIDENVGRLRKRLKELELERDTLLIFMTDNGSAAGAGRFNAGMRAGKGSAFDGGHRVPCFWHWPGGELSAGRDVDQLSAHIDLLPTLVELCGLEQPDGPPLDGTSLVPALRGNEAALRDRTLFVHSQRIPYPQKWKTSSVMTERWRLVNGEQLYDIQADPGQQTDVAAGHPDVVQRLVASYEAWWQSLSPVFDQFVRIGLGNDAEPETQLHAHDWHVEAGGGVPWNQGHLRAGHDGNGYWAVDVQTAGRYEVELRRWPRQTDRELEAESGAIQFGESRLEKKAEPGDTRMVFQLDVPRGPTRLQTWLTRSDGRQQGAFFVYVRRIE